jgi:hypothetical protein
MQLRGLVFLALTAACSDVAVDEVENACDDYCTLVLRHCQGTVAQYSDVSTCLATCRTMALGNPGDREGNTIACRTFWAAVAEGDTMDCTRAGPGGDGACGSNCESFCAATLDICVDQESPPYASLGECMGACAGYSTTERYDATDVGGNTFACRLYHMTAASADPDTHCQHTGVNSAVCL